MSLSDQDKPIPDYVPLSVREAGPVAIRAFLQPVATAVAFIQLQEEHDRLERELVAARAALGILADPENWSGNPHWHGSHLYGHFTPLELASAALEQGTR